ncbi:MAG: hypothetical protein LLG37_03110 [Spirochaetia bacterium]|nr:hypothetical protein [Spirochaetia bacterium]
MFTRHSLSRLRGQFHRFLTEGIHVNMRVDGQERDETVYHNPANNSFYAVNQFTIIEKNQNKRPDIILFVNGLPLVVIELKNSADENATARKAYDQIQTYKKPSRRFSFITPCAWYTTGWRPGQAPYPLLFPGASLGKVLMA